MKTPSHYVGLALLWAPFLYQLYIAIRAGHFKYLAKGAAWVVATVAWSALVVYLLSH